MELLSNQWYANMTAHSCVLSATEDTVANTQLSSTSDVNASIQDSSILSPFLETTKSEHCNAFPPTSDTNLLPHSDGFSLNLLLLFSYILQNMLTSTLAQSKRIYVVANANFMTQRLAIYAFLMEKLSTFGKIIYLLLMVKLRALLEISMDLL